MEGRIDIEYDDGRIHESVQVAAEFTDWNPVPLGLDSNTRYAAVFDGAETASLYHYKFIVDGQWSLLPGLETAHDRAGNVNHFAVAKPIQANYKQPQSQSPRQYNHKETNTSGITGGYGNDLDKQSAPGGGQFGGPADAAVRQAPTETSEFPRSSTKSEFQQVTGFKPDNGIEERSANEAQQALSSSQLRSEPYDVVKETPGSFSPSNRFVPPVDSYSGVGTKGIDTTDIAATGIATTGVAAPSGSGTSGFDYASEFDRNPAQSYGDASGGYGYNEKLSNKTFEPVNDSYQTALDAKPNTGYEFTDAQLPEPKEDITGAGSGSYGGSKYGTYDSKPNTGYEYTERQLLEPKEDVTGAGSGSYGGSNYGTYSSKPNTGYEYTERQLLEPKEDILDGAEYQQEPASAGYGTGYESGYNSGFDQRGYDSGYEYKESQLADAKEDISQGASGYTGTSQKPDSSYEYKDSDLTKPKEKVAENFATDDEYTDAYEDASMPGTLPFERKVLGGENVPGNALDSKASDFATSSKGISEKPLSSGRGYSGYADSGVSKPPGEQSFYDSALEQLDEDDEADVFEEIPADPSELDQATGLPGSLSDRTIAKSGGDYYGTESGLDQAAAYKVVSEETPSTPTEKKRYEPEPYATSYSPHNHQPIDVNTGFPIDHPESYGPLGQQQQPQRHSSHGPTVRNHEHRRSLKSRDRDPPPPPITSQEHRSAAVIAAASKASAFAKQDVAAISGRVETNRGGSQTSPAVSRGASVRSSQGFNRSRDSGQFNYSPSSQQQQQQSTYNSVPRQGTTTTAQQYSTASSSPTQVQPAQLQQSRPVLKVGTGAAAGTETGGATSAPLAAGFNPDPYASDPSQLQRSQSMRKEGRLKRLFKLR